MPARLGPPAKAGEARIEPRDELVRLGVGDELLAFLGLRIEEHGELAFLKADRAGGLVHFQQPVAGKTQSEFGRRRQAPLRALRPCLSLLRHGAFVRIHGKRPQRGVHVPQS